MCYKKKYTLVDIFINKYEDIKVITLSKEWNMKTYSLVNMKIENKNDGSPCKFKYWYKD